MKIDIATLFIVLMMNCAVVGVIFIVAWFRDRATIQFRVGVAALVLALGVFLLVLRGRIPDRISIDIANVLILAGLGIGWSGIRAFEGRPAPAFLVFAGSAAWLLTCLFPPIYDSLAHRMIVASLLSAAYLFACGYEFSRKRREVLRSRRPIAIFFFIQTGVILLRGVNAYFDPPAGAFEGNWLHTILIGEPALMVFALSILGVILVRERGENLLRQKAETDDLTGALNRRAIMSEGARVIADAARNRLPVALLLFDLDHFKLINDRFGHFAGDQILRSFARIAGQAVRQTDLFGRIGGEEFAALLPGTDERTAGLIAERIRIEFSRATSPASGLAATVSIGVAVAPAAETSLEALMGNADRALYQAKRAGRDRVIGTPALAS